MIIGDIVSYFNYLIKCLFVDRKAKSAKKGLNYLEWMFNASSLKDDKSKKSLQN